MDRVSAHVHMIRVKSASLAPLRNQAQIEVNSFYIIFRTELVAGGCVDEIEITYWRVAGWEKLLWVWEGREVD
mgnify:CR=1 FL=1